MDRNPDDHRQGFHRQPFVPPHSRYPDPQILGTPYHTQHHYPYPPKEHCCCVGIASQLNFIDRRMAAIQTTIENIATQLKCSTGPQQAMQSSGSTQEAMEPEIPPLVIPPTSRERKQLIKQMEEELEKRREENRQHEDRISGLRRELEQLKERN